MLNENIKNIRKNKGFTQEELAARLHVTRQTISKWERGASVPDAALLSDMAEIMDVSVSDLLGEKAIERHDQDAIIEQLSRINEQMAIRNRRATRIIKTLAIMFVVAIAVIGTIFFLNVGHPQTKRLTTDHIGKLAYVLPEGDFFHDNDDVGVTLEENGRERISAKSYKLFSDMTEITVWAYDSYDKEVLDEFTKNHKNDLIEFSDEHGELPAIIDEIIAATDETDEYIGRYYEAYVVIGDKMYCVEVQNGDDPLGNGEMLIASMSIDETLKDEYRD